MPKSQHIDFIETLRALAAISVMGFHFICFNNGVEDIYWNESVKHAVSFGAQGVEMFYIISGFVITYALTMRNYKIKHYGKYLLKRMIRIIPVYWIVIVSIFMVEFILFWNTKLELDYFNILANFTFTVELWEGTTWINPVFSTLAVEFQFYILIGLILPLFKVSNWLKYGVLIIMILIGYLTLGHQTVFTNAPYFVIGIILHDVYGKRNIYISYFFFALILLFLLRYYPVEDFAVSILTITLFLFVKPSYKWSNNLGRVSYSLYLTHGLFGGWILYFLSRDEYINLPFYIIIPLAIIFSVLGATVYYYLFEKPSIKLGKKIWYT